MELVAKASARGAPVVHGGMTTFTALEFAALQSIFAETPGLTAGLERQLDCAIVTERENSGWGFFTTISVQGDVPPVDSPRMLGLETLARIHGLEHGFGFVLYMEGGCLSLLEGYAQGGESTAAFDLTNLHFKVYRPSLQTG